MNKISVIVPIYNIPTLMLDKCIESLISQTYKNIEIILVNDGSNEANVNTCNKYIKLDKRTKLINQKNMGLSAARNTGVNNASGDWITFLDGDDYLEKDGLKRVIDRVKGNPEVVCFGTIKEYRNSSFLYEFGNLFEDGKNYKEDSKIFLDVLFDFESNISDATAKLYKRDFLIKEKIFHNSVIRQGVEAFDFNFEVFKRTKEILFLKEYIYHYTYNQNSITMKPSTNSYEQLLSGLEIVEKKVLKLNDNIVTKSFYNRIRYIIVTTAVSGYFNPTSKETYIERKKKFNEFLKKTIIEKALRSKGKIDIKRKIILFFISNHIYAPVYLLAKIRKVQKEY